MQRPPRDHNGANRVARGQRPTRCPLTAEELMTCTAVARDPVFTVRMSGMPGPVHGSD
jgi:hypothetical protein